MSERALRIETRSRNGKSKLLVLALSAAALVGCDNSDTGTAKENTSTTVVAETQSTPPSITENSQSPNVSAPSPEKKKAGTHKVIATKFWIGEEATASNGFIANDVTAWDEHAVERFGGVDADTGRNFTPKHNTFYFALPAAEYDEKGPIPGAHERSPWADEAASLKQGESLFKGRWIKLEANGVTAYAQWIDVGPNESFDYPYVFGDELPVNQFGQKAGVDLSPDAAAFLGTGGSGLVEWEFVDETEVGDGPWKAYPPIDNQTHWD